MTTGCAVSAERALFEWQCQRPVAISDSNHLWIPIQLEQLLTLPGLPNKGVTANWPQSGKLVCYDYDQGQARVILLTAASSAKLASCWPQLPAYLPYHPLDPKWQPVLHMVLASRLAPLFQLLPATTDYPPHLSLTAPPLAVKLADFKELDNSYLASYLSVACKLPLTGNANVQLALFRNNFAEHVVLQFGKLNPKREILLRIHSECLTGDVFHSLRCDCGAQLQLAIDAINQAGGGLLLYLREEGRNIGLANKILAYRLQENGFDTFDANRHLGFPWDNRNYRDAIQILQQLDITKVALLTNNPDKVQRLQQAGVTVRQLPLVTTANQQNRKYLDSKRTRTSHRLPGSSQPD